MAKGKGMQTEKGEGESVGVQTEVVTPDKVKVTNAMVQTEKEISKTIV
jgi:hypothetical protein